MRCALLAAITCRFSRCRPVMEQKKVYIIGQGKQILPFIPTLLLNPLSPLHHHHFAKIDQPDDAFIVELDICR